MSWRVSRVWVESVNDLSTEAEVGLPLVRNGSRALAVVSGSWVTITDVPGMEGAVRLPEPLVVPFKARLAT